MKRTYISPVSTIIKLHPQRMLALSSVEVSSSYYDEGNMTDLVKGNQSQNYSIWDDDWSNE